MAERIPGGLEELPQVFPGMLVSVGMSDADRAQDYRDKCRELLVQAIRHRGRNVQQWNYIAIPFVPVMADSEESPQFSITLPLEAIDMIENGLTIG